MHRLLGITLALAGLVLGAAPLAAADKDRENQSGKQAKSARQGERAFLGVAVKATGPNADEEGVLVRQVMPDSPADRAGLRRGDVITRVDGRQVEDPTDLLNVLAKHHPGQSLNFQVMRDEEQKTLRVTLGKAPKVSRAGPGAEEAERPGREGRERGASGREQEAAFLGVQAVPIDELTPRLKRRLGITHEEGLVVMEVVPDSPASEAGLEHGDVITAINGKQVEDIDELRDAIRKMGVGKEVRLQVMRGKQKKQLTAKLEEAPVGGLRTLGHFGEAGELGRFPMGFGEQRRMERLERRIQILERRLHELEQQQGKRPKSKGEAEE